MHESGREKEMSGMKCDANKDAGFLNGTNGFHFAPLKSIHLHLTCISSI